MIVQHFTTPWEHWIIDDFLSCQDYSSLLNWFDQQPSVDRHERNRTKGGPEEIERVLTESFLEAISYTKFNQAGKISIALEKVNPGESFDEPHCDTQTKLLSLVLYVGQDNNATIVHDSKETEGTMLEWKGNRAFMFIVKQGVTWHSYHNHNTTEPRCTALLNIYSN